MDQVWYLIRDEEMTSVSRIYLHQTLIVYMGCVLCLTVLLVLSHEVSLELCLAYQHERAWVGLLERACSSMVQYG